MNTLLNNAQFAKRLGAIETKYGKGSIVTFSSIHKGNKYTHINSLAELYNLCRKASTTPRIVLMCTNKRRRCDGVEFLQELEDGAFDHIKRAHVYYDEIHKYIDEGKKTNLRSQIEKISLFNIVHSITGLSATPDNVYKDTGIWSSIFNQSNNDDMLYKNYIGCEDMNYTYIDDFFDTPYVYPRSLDGCDKHTISFVQHVLDNHPDILSDNTRTFIPAHIQCVGHYAIRDLIFDTNPRAVVILINGDEKTIQYRDHADNMMTIPLISNDEEVCETIYRLINSEKIQDRPVVITGYLCVSMGQTLTNRLSGSFTSAIFSHLSLTNDEIYQLFGRLAGRMRDWETYIQTHVYCPKIIKHRVCAMERCAKKQVPNNGGNGSYVTRSEYRAPMYEMEGGLDAETNNMRSTKKPKSKEGNVKVSKYRESRVPIIIDEFTGDEAIFHFPNGEKNKDKKVGFVVDFIKDKEKYERLYNFITNPNTKCCQATKPNLDGSYQKHINPLVKHIHSNVPCSIDFKPEDKLTNSWNLYIDNREHRLFVLLWVIDDELY